VCVCVVCVCVCVSCVCVSCRVSCVSSVGWGVPVWGARDLSWLKVRMVASMVFSMTSFSTNTSFVCPMR
jgi:hypothetical protein